MLNKSLPVVMASKAKSVKVSSGNDDAKQEKDKKPVKVDKWDGSALKNALDDAAKEVLKEKLGYKESHSLMDGRLAICTVAIGFALFALVWDYLYPFPKSRAALIGCVITYFLLMVILTLYTMYAERGCFMVALQKDEAGVDPDNIWKLASCLKRYDDMYELFMSCTDGITGKIIENSFTDSVANFFDENGYICKDIYETEVLKLHSSLSKEKKEN